MAAELEDLRAGEIKMLLEGQQPYRSIDGVQGQRTKLLPFAHIRARGTTNPDYEYVVPTEYLFGDIFLSTHGTGGEEAAEFGFPQVSLEYTDRQAAYSAKADDRGTTEVHYYRRMLEV